MFRSSIAILFPIGKVGRRPSNFGFNHEQILAHFNAKAPAIYTGIKMLLFAVGVAASALLLMPMDISLMKKTVTIMGI